MMNFLKKQELTLARIDTVGRAIAEFLEQFESKSRPDLECWREHYDGVLKCLMSELGWSAKAREIFLITKSWKRKTKGTIQNYLTQFGFLDNFRGSSPIFRGASVSMPFPPEFTTYQTAYGFLLCSNALDMCHVLATGHYHAELSESLIVLRILPWIDCFVDVGANIGFYSLLAATQGEGRVKVIALEPSKSNFANLSAGIRANDLVDSIAALPVAASDREGMGSLHLYSSGSGGNSLEPPPSEKPFGQIQQVDMHTLDHIVKEFGLEIHRTLLKVDVEGAERLVFAGAKAWINSAFCPIVLFESWPDSKFHRGNNHLKSVQILRDSGYAIYGIYRLEDGKSVIYKLPEKTKFKPSESGNYLAIPGWANKIAASVAGPADLRIFSEYDKLVSFQNFLEANLAVLTQPAGVH